MWHCGRASHESDYYYDDSITADDHNHYSEFDDYDNNTRYHDYAYAHKTPQETSQAEAPRVDDDNHHYHCAQAVECHGLY